MPQPGNAARCGRGHSLVSVPQRRQVGWKRATILTMNAALLQDGRGDFFRLTNPVIWAPAGGPPWHWSCSVGDVTSGLVGENYGRCPGNSTRSCTVEWSTMQLVAKFCGHRSLGRYKTRQIQLIGSDGDPPHTGEMYAAVDQARRGPSAAGSRTAVGAAAPAGSVWSGIAD